MADAIAMAVRTEASPDGDPALVLDRTARRRSGSPVFEPEVVGEVPEQGNPVTAENGHAGEGKALDQSRHRGAL